MEARRLLLGGTVGNRRLTATTAAVLLVLLAAEGATLLVLRSLLAVHVFLGMLLIPVVTLKLASTGYVAGATLAIATLPLARPWLHWSGHGQHEDMATRIVS